MAIGRFLKRDGKGHERLAPVRLPSAAVVRSLEDAMWLEERYGRNLIVVHDPDFLAGKKPYFRLDGALIEGMFLPSQRVSENVAGIYRNARDTDTPKITSELLEETVNAQTEKREVSQQRLARFAEGLGGYDNSNAQQAKELISLLITGQFEYLEHFITEEIQNAAGAIGAAGISDGKIDVYLDRQDRYVRISDNGIGMSAATLNNVYFNFFKSLNALLKTAEGRYGLGAKAKFGIGHKYIAIDTKPINPEEEGGYVMVDSKLEREQNHAPTRRGKHGTTIEIKLSETSQINFDRIVETLVKDCKYVETPIYVQEEGKTPMKINVPLISEGPGSINFKEERAQGHIRIIPYGLEGTVELLSHNIKLAEIKARGYEGAINCNDFSKTFSRDTVKEDSVLAEVLAYAQMKATELRKSQTTELQNASVEERLIRYSGFLKRTLYREDGTYNSTWIKSNIKEILELIENPEKKVRNKGGSLMSKTWNFAKPAFLAGTAALLAANEVGGIMQTYEHIQAVQGIDGEVMVKSLMLLLGAAETIMLGNVASSSISGKASLFDKAANGLNAYVGNRSLKRQIRRAEMQAGEQLFEEYKEVRQDSKLERIAYALTPARIADKAGKAYAGLMDKVHKLRGSSSAQDAEDEELTRAEEQYVKGLLENAGIRDVTVRYQHKRGSHNSSVEVSDGNKTVRDKRRIYAPWGIAMQYAAKAADIGALRRVVETVIGGAK